MPLALLPPWSSNFLPLERPTEVQCCAPGSQGEARERLPADERGGGARSVPSPASGAIQGTLRTNVKMSATRKLTAIEFER